ncbi:L,D-transpeptidase [Mesorhizobium sp. M1423]
MADLDTSGRNGRSRSKGGEICRRHEGGPDNPLGARALYLYERDQDTIYRIHGTPEPWTIGLDVSSGCIRMRNDDIVDLASRVKVGAKVIVLMQGAALYKGV